MDHRPHSFWHRRRVFVTGCTGFLGTWVVRELLARGAEVIGLVRDRARTSDFFEQGLFARVAIVRGRIEDRGRLETAFALHGVQTVFHLAAPALALSHTPEPTHHPAARWTLTVLQAAARAARGAEVLVPVGVGDPTGRTEVVTQFVRQTGSPAALLALPELFGDGDRTWARLFPRMVRNLLIDEPVEPPTAEEQVRPYLDVRLAAQAFLTTAEALAADPEAWAGRTVAVPGSTSGAQLHAAVTSLGEPPPEPLPGEAAPLLTRVRAAVAWYRRYLRAVESPASPRPTRFAA